MPSDLIKSHLSNDVRNHIRLFSDEIPDWGERIKGDDENRDYPARVFYNEILPVKFEQYPFIQQMVIPEVMISQIVPKKGQFYRQQVDFYLSDAKLVIEIDGVQHEDDEQKNLDLQRDRFLSNHGIATVRISAKSIKDQDSDLDKALGIIQDRINLFSDEFNQAKLCYQLTKEGKLENELKAIAIMRFQIMILELCDRGILQLDSKEWRIAVKNHEVSGYEKIAIDDVLNWLESLFDLAGESFSRPSVEILETKDIKEVSDEYIKIEFSLTKMLSQIKCEGEDTICVANSGRQDLDYFKVSVAEPIKYKASGDAKSDRAIHYLLKNIFGYSRFRPGQKRIIYNALKKRDTIGILPTGSGKTICYQMVALLQPDISMCVSPIKSLMIDQVNNARSKGISRIAYISSDQDAHEREYIQSQFANTRLLWIYVAPERFQSKSFREYLSCIYNSSNARFGYVVIDEVHCMSEWGHTFRVSYLNLVKTIRSYCPKASIIGLTATASLRVLKNIMIEFGMKDKADVITVESFTRPELHFVVKKVPSRRKQQALIQLLDGYRDRYADLFTKQGEGARCGIIFTPFVNGKYGCFELSGALSKAYEADIRSFAGSKPKEWKKRSWPKYNQNAQDDFKDNKYTLLCATKAFGMGIDKPNVRYTVHYGIPSSLEALYQEAGRAGRDGQKAECTVLYSNDEALREQVEFCLGKSASISELRKFVEDNKESSVEKGDGYRQLSLLAHEMVDITEELADIFKLLEREYEKGKVKRIYASSKDHFDNLQKALYHLATIGVVEDWTVDWKSYSCEVIFGTKTIEDLIDTTEEYIRNYDHEYRLAREIQEIPENELDSIMSLLKTFLDWYQDNILYTRRQALLNVMYACDAFDRNNSVDFKKNMEAYFRINDLAEVFFAIVENPQNINLWFHVLNAEKIRYEKIENIIMTLNRFLESYQNNAGLNYISGILNFLNGDFESAYGKNRLLQSLTTINTFDDARKGVILETTTRLILDFTDSKQQEIFSKFIIKNYNYKRTVSTVCRIIKDDYSLGIVLKKYDNG